MKQRSTVGCAVVCSCLATTGESVLDQTFSQAELELALTNYPRRVELPPGLAGLVVLTEDPRYLLWSGLRLMGGQQVVRVG